MPRFNTLADPLAAVEIHNQLFSIFDRDGTIDTGMFLCATASAGGFASQQAVWKACIEPDERNPGDFLYVAGTKTGESFYFGEPINMFLFGARDALSFYNVVVGIITDPGPKTLPNLTEITHHVASSVGTPEFWNVRVPKPLPPLPSIHTALTSYWKGIQEILMRYRNPASQWPLILGFVAARVAKALAKDLPPPLVARMIIEAAVIASKADPRIVPGATSGLVGPAKWSNRGVMPETWQLVREETFKFLPKRIPG